MDSSRKSLTEEYQKLSTQHALTQKQRDGFQMKITSLEKEVEAQKSLVSELDAQIAKAEKRLEFLSEDAVRRMIKAKNYYDSSLNPNGTGIENKFKPQHDNSVVYDAATGLTWQQSGSTDLMNYSEAEAYIQKLRSKQFAGFNDWRLPTLEEAMSLMEPAKNKDGLFINPRFDKRQKDCWSIDSEKSSDDAWEVEFDDGKVDTESKNHRNYVRAVR